MIRQRTVMALSLLSTASIVAAFVLLMSGSGEAADGGATGGPTPTPLPWAVKDDATQVIATGANEGATYNVSIDAKSEDREVEVCVERPVEGSDPVEWEEVGDCVILDPPRGKSSSSNFPLEGGDRLRVTDIDVGTNGGTKAPTGTFTKM